MNADIDHRSALAGWVWVLAAFALALILGAMYWSTRSSDSQRTDTDINRYAPIEGEHVQSVMTPAPAPAPPDTSYASEDADLRSPAVTVTEVRPTPAPKHLPRLAGSVEPKANSVADMFPMDRVAGPPESRVEAPPPKATAMEEFPSFEYGGKTWSYTGEQIARADVDLVPIGRQVGDRGVYALSGDGASGDVLFVGSANGDEYAVYRQG